MKASQSHEERHGTSPESQDRGTRCRGEQLTGDDSWMRPGSPKAVIRSTGNPIGSGAAEDSVEGEDSCSQKSGVQDQGGRDGMAMVRLQALDADRHRPGNSGCNSTAWCN